MTGVEFKLFRRVIVYDATVRVGQAKEPAIASTGCWKQKEPTRTRRLLLLHVRVRGTIHGHKANKGQFI